MNRYFSNQPQPAHLTSEGRARQLMYWGFVAVLGNVLGLIYWKKIILNIGSNSLLVILALGHVS